jgi:hypothetical protein
LVRFFINRFVAQNKRAQVCCFTSYDLRTLKAAAAIACGRHKQVECR